MVSGKFNRCLIIHLGNLDGEDEEEIVIGKEALICMGHDCHTQTGF